MRTRFATMIGLFALCFFIPSTAAHAQRLYPVQGPATAQTPPPNFTAKLTNYLKNSGVITLTQDGGETFQGPWTTVTVTFINSKTPGTASSYPPQPNLAFAWDLVYGPGYYAANVAGKKVLQGTFTGDKGTTLQVQSLDNFVAVGEDNRGNLYKIVW